MYSLQKPLKSLKYGKDCGGKSDAQRSDYDIR